MIVVNAGGVRNSNTGHKCGTIISANTGQLPPIGVEFDEYVHGHDCNHKGRYGYCFNINAVEIGCRRFKSVLR